MAITATYDPEADALDVRLRDFPDRPGIAQRTAHVDDYHHIELDEKGEPLVLTVLYAGKPGQLDLEEVARAHGLADQLAAIYKAIAEAYARERIAA